MNNECFVAVTFCTSSSAKAIISHTFHESAHSRIDIRPKMTRIDGRSPTDIRASSIVTGIIANSCGSACAQIGGNKVVCSIRGPLQLTTEYRGNKGKIVCNVSYAPFALNNGLRLDPQNSSRGISSDRDLSFALEGICEQVVVLETFPQLYYELNFVVLSSEGGDDLPVLCSAACSALLQAGVEMSDVFAGSSSALCSDPELHSSGPSSSSPTIIVDPSYAERLSCPAVCSVVATTSTGKTLFYSHEGSTRPETISSMFQHAVAGCIAQRETLVNSAIK